MEKTGEVRNEEMAILTRGGDQRTVMLSASQVSDEKGKTLYYVSIQRDITEQRRLEAQERTYQRQLAHVSRLTVAGELASGIAHELNQPLGAIATFSAGCKRLIDSGEAESPEVRDALVQISAQAQRGGEIIRRMRRFVSKHELEFSLTDINAIVREAFRLVQIGEADAGIELSLGLAEGPLTVLVDRIQMQQVIVNLVQNGLDAMRETEGVRRTLTVRTARLDQDRVEVTVTDRGKGLVDEDIERVFEPFFTTKPQGLGIGLSISRSIVEVHKGKIWARSNPDQGMTFGFELSSK
jgi:two-component system sensor kinase FixL